MLCSNKNDSPVCENFLYTTQHLHNPQLNTQHKTQYNTHGGICRGRGITLSLVWSQKQSTPFSYLPRHGKTLTGFTYKYNPNHSMVVYWSPLMILNPAARGRILSGG